MAISKMNLLQALGSIASLLIYLFMPILGISVLIPVGFTGETCMQLGTLFVVPVVLMGITLIISLLPIGPFNSIAGIATGISMLVIGSMSKNVAAAKVNELAALAGLSLDLSNYGVNFQLGSYAAMALKMSWGLIIPIIIMLSTAILGMLISVFVESRSKAKHTNAPSGHYGSTAGGAARPSRPTPGTGTTSHRSRSTRYHS